MAERRQNSNYLKYSPMQYDTNGTPMQVKSPLNHIKQQAEKKENNQKMMKKLIIVTFVSVFFITAQLIGGYLAGSIAIFTDSAHLASDLMGFGISMLSLKLGERGASDNLTFGWHRAEVIGTLVSVASIWIMTVWLFVEATTRFFKPTEVKGDIMLIVAIMGLIFNIIQVKILHSGDGHYHLGGDEHGGCSHEHDHEHDHKHHHHSHSGHSHKSSIVSSQKKGIADAFNKDVNQQLLDKQADNKAINGDEEDGHSHGSHGHEHTHKHNEGKNMLVDAAMLHVMGDLLMSVGVILAATIIYFSPKLWYCDPLCTYLFSIIVMVTTIPIVKNCIKILMEGCPANISLEELRQELYNSNPKENLEVHNLHVWTIAPGMISMSAHITSLKPLQSLARATDICRRKFNLHDTTIQVEGIDDKKRNAHAFKCEEYYPNQHTD